MVWKELIASINSLLGTWDHSLSRCPSMKGAGAGADVTKVKEAIKKEVMKRCATELIIKWALRRHSIAELVCRFLCFGRRFSYAGTFATKRCACADLRDLLAFLGTSCFFNFFKWA